MSAAVILGVLGAIAAAVLTSLLTKETEGLIEALPGLMLRLARRRPPAEGRDELYAARHCCTGTIPRTSGPWWTRWRCPTWSTSTS